MPMFSWEEEEEEEEEEVTENEEGLGMDGIHPPTLLNITYKQDEMNIQR
jgi:hypothetical protein